jgi:hypothetical protein
MAGDCKTTNFWRARNSGHFVTGRMAVGLLHGLTTGKGSYCKGTAFVCCFLCNAEPYGGHAIRVLWYAGSLRQEVFATGSVQSLGAFAKLRTTTVRILGFRYRASTTDYKTKVSNRCNQIYIFIVYVTSHPTCFGS